jgi:hypothetical protein
VNYNYGGVNKEWLSLITKNELSNDKPLIISENTIIKVINNAELLDIKNYYEYFLGYYIIEKSSKTTIGCCRVPTYMDFGSFSSRMEFDKIRFLVLIMYILACQRILDLSTKCV